MSYRRHLLPAASLLLCLTTCAVAVRSYFALDNFHVPAGSVEIYVDVSRGDALLQLVMHVPPPSRGNQPFHGSAHAQPFNFPDTDPRFTAHALLGHHVARFTDPRLGITGYLYLFPLWHLIVLTAILPLLHAHRLWRTRHPRPPHVCPTCGYDCRATPDRCPECGTVLPSTISPAIPPTPPL